MPERAGTSDAVGDDGGPPAGGDGQGRTGDDPAPTDDVPVRRGSVDLRLHDGTRVHHDEADVRYEPDAFVVASDTSSSGVTTERYPKTAVAWLEVRHPRR
jgi:hypothetical protein